MSKKRLRLSPGSLADNSDQPRMLKMADYDIWTKWDKIKYWLTKLWRWDLSNGNIANARKSDEE